MTACMGRLTHELGTSVLASQEDTAAVGRHDMIPGPLRHLVHHAMVFGAPYTSIVDHAIIPELTIIRFRTTSRHLKDDHVHI